MRKTCEYWVGPISHPSDEAGFTVGLMLYSTRLLTRYGYFDNTGVCDICQRCTEMEEQITEIKFNYPLRCHEKNASENVVC